MISGEIKDKENVIVRVHDQCFTSEVFGSQRCDCSEQLQESLKLIKTEDGIVIYLQQEGRGIGIANKVAAYNLQDQGLDTIDANIHLGFKDEMREYYCVPKILNDLGIKSIRLITNNPFKINQLTNLGVNITDRISVVIPPNKHNFRYLSSKRDRMNHILPHNSDITSDTNSDIINKFRGGADSSTEQIIDFNHIDTNTLEKGYALGRESVLAAINAISEGQIVIVVDDENRENEGDFIMAAEKATTESIGFFVRHTSGVICISLESDRLDYLKLPPMVINNEDPKQTAYTISVDYKHNTTTGISAYDRASCFRALVDPNSKPEDFSRPGHVFPLRYKPGGVLVRGGHTEASIDLCRLAGLKPGGVLAEVVNDDGSLKRLPDLIQMSKEYNLVITSVQDIIAYRKELLNNES
eukprot:gene26334-34451_t